MSSDPSGGNKTLQIRVRSFEDLFLDEQQQIKRVKKKHLFRVKCFDSLQMKDLIKTYCSRNNLDPKCIIFRFAGKTLLPDQTCKSLFMMDDDEITVHQSPGFITDSSDKSTMESDMKKMLEDPVSADIVFIVGEEKEPISAHSAILSARSDRMKAMLVNANMEEKKNWKGYCPQSFA